jgi:hypothetical protein
VNVVALVNNRLDSQSKEDGRNQGTPLNENFHKRAVDYMQQSGGTRSFGLISLEIAMLQFLHNGTCHDGLRLKCMRCSVRDHELQVTIAEVGLADRTFFTLPLRCASLCEGLHNYARAIGDKHAE